MVVGSSLRVGGAERVALQQAERWSECTDVSLLTLEASASDFYSAAAVERHELDEPGGRRRRLTRLRKLRRVLRSGDADVVIAHQDWVGLLVLAADLGPGRARTPVVVAEHSDPAEAPQRPLLRLMRRHLYRRAAAVVCLTEQGASWLREELGLDVDVIPNPAPPVTSPTREERPVDVLFAGRLDSHKRVGLLLDAVATLRGRGRALTVRILGDGDQRTLLESRARDLAISGCVEFTGAVTAVAPHLRESKVLCLLSEREGHPMVLLEAMSEGCVPIATDCRTGPREIIDHGIDGLLLSLDPSVSDVADAIQSILDDATDRARMAAGARRRAASLSSDVVDQRWAALIGRVAARNEPRRVGADHDRL